MAMTRRYFFYGSLLAGAVPAVGFGSTTSLKSLGYKSPNEKLNFGSIGSGGQAASNIGAAAPTENIVALCDVDDRRAAQHLQTVPQCAEVQRLPRMLDKEGKNIDAVHRGHSGSHARHRGHVVPWSAASTSMCRSRWCAPFGKRASCAKRPTNTRWPRRWATRATPTKAPARPPRSSGTAISAMSPKCMPGATGRCGRRALPRSRQPDPVPSYLDWDLWLGVAEKRPFTADGKTEPGPNDAFFYQPFNWRGFYDFGCGALGDMACHILGAPNMALHLSQPQDRQRGVREEGRHQPLHVPQGVGDPLRFRAVWRHAGAESLLV